MYQGSSALVLDTKGRMLIPARHRDALLAQCNGQLTLTKHPHGCLLLFPRPVWEQQREKIAAWPLSARSWQRIFLGSAVDIDFDSAGRILISPELRRAAPLEKDVMLIGMGSHFEVWDRATLERHEQETIAAGLPEGLRDFAF